MAAGVISRPPLVKGWPLLGSAIPLARDIQKFLTAGYSRYGPAFRVRALNHEFTVLAGPEAVALMAANDDSLSTWETWEGVIRDWGGRKIITMLEGEEHAFQRKVMRSGFSKQKVYESIPLVAQLTQAALKPYAVGERIPVLEFARQLVGNQLGMMTLGRMPGDFNQAFVTFLHAQLKANFMHTESQRILHKPEYLRARERVEAFAQDIIKRYRSGEMKRGESNFADDLMDAAEQYPDLMNERELLLTVLTPYLAGLDTVVSALLFMLYEIHRQPALLNRLRAEVDAAFANGIPDANAFRRMDSLHAACLETLRLYPVAGILMRVAKRSFEFQGYQINQGEFLMFGMAVTHCMEKYFKNPNQFDIDRFMEPRNEHKQRGVFAPYGAGSHTCLGAGMGEVQLAVTLATLLRVSELALDPPNYKIRKFQERELSPDNQFYLKKLGERPLPTTWLLEAEEEPERVAVQ
jgi:cytochrome P450